MTTDAHKQLKKPKKRLNFEDNPEILQKQRWPLDRDDTLLMSTRNSSEIINNHAIMFLQTGQIYFILHRAICIRSILFLSE